MYLVTKIVLLAIYALAILSFFITPPFAWAQELRILAAVILLAHTFEAILFWKNVRLYPGPLALSILLTLLFGFLHWKPLADAHKSSAG
jgi:hypothetical protein